VTANLVSEVGFVNGQFLVELMIVLLSCRMSSRYSSLEEFVGKERRGAMQRVSVALQGRLRRDFVVYITAA